MTENKKWIVRLAKCAVLLLGVWGLYVLWHAHVSTPLIIVDDDDISVNPRVPVHVGTIAVATLHQYIAADGVVEPEPARGDRPAAVAVITTPGASVIDEVDCREGERVKQGDVLFTTAKDEKLISPLGGTVVQLNIHPGEVVTQYSAAVQVVDLNRLVVAVAIPASQLGRVKVGQNAGIILPGAGAAATSRPAEAAVVRFVDPSVDPKTNMGSVDVSALVESGVRLGQFVHVEIETDVHTGCLAVPEESVSNDSQGQPSIGVVVRDFRWAVREPVEIGLRERGMVEVRAADLKAGEDIVTTGAYALPEKSRIEVDR